MAGTLTVASHTQENMYLAGGNYELNLSFDTLRDKQWQRVIQAIWDDPSLNGPLVDRYIPGKPAGEKIPIQVPPPTATLTHHGQLSVDGKIIGCDVLITRSLFECISILVPVGMFSGLSGDLGLRNEHPELQELDDVFGNIALRVYDTAPFKIAAIGYERGCQLLAELRIDAEMRHKFLVTGNFMAQEDVLLAIEPDLSGYQEVKTNLYWLPPRL